MDDEADILARAQQRLLRNRADLAAAPIPAPIAAAIAPGATIDPRSLQRPSTRFEPADPSPSERAQAIRRALQREIPPRFTWARWDSPELPAHVAGGAAWIATVRRELDQRPPRIVFVGAARTGKTSLAVAHLAERIQAGVERARFIPARTLLGASHIDGVSVAALALSAGLLVLDDLGAELTGAPPGSGLAAQRIEVVSKLIADRHDLDRGHVVTTAHDRAALAAMYGDGVAGRVFEGALVVRCRS